MSELYESETILQLLLVTGVIGGGAAWLAGRAIARTWRPWWQAAAYMMLLGAAIRFVHFALFDADLLSLLSYAVDTAWAMAAGCLSWRVARADQMARQYPWLYERTSPLTWRSRTPASSSPEGVE